MKKISFSATAIAMWMAIPAQAEQFAIRLDDAFQGANESLMETLKVSQIEEFSVGADSYVILEAPGEAWVEAFFLAIGQDAVELKAIDADWERPAMQALTLSQRMSFTRTLACDFCAG